MYIITAFSGRGYAGVMSLLAGMTGRRKQGREYVSEDVSEGVGEKVVYRDSDASKNNKH